MSLDITADSRRAASAAEFNSEPDDEPPGRLWLYELLVAAAAAFGAVLASVASVLLYLR